MDRHYELNQNGLYMPKIYSSVLNQLVANAVTLAGNDGTGEGGYLATTPTDAGILIAVPAGIIPDEKINGRRRNATVKVTTVIEHKVVRSFERRNVDNGIYGGGVRLRRQHVTGFSGFSLELVDEAVSVNYGTYDELRAGVVMFEKDPEFKALPDELIYLVTEWKNSFAPDNPFIIPLALKTFRGDKVIFHDI